MVGLLRSEFIKFRTVRSHVVMVVIAVVVPVGLTALIAALIGKDNFDDVEDTFNIVTSAIGITQILMAVMGALVIAAEYRFNTIRVTFTAVPNRVQVLVAKVIVVIAVATIIGVVTLVLDTGVAKAILEARDIPFDLNGDGVARALLGQVVVTVLYGLAGFGLGALFRSPVAAITVVVCQPIIVEPIVVGVASEIGKWLPFAAGSALTTVDPPEEYLQSPLTGGLVLTAYCALLVVAGAVFVNTRDA
jgi:ABC-2 type transport system permease protein